MRNLYIEAKEMLGKITGKKNIIIYSDGYGPLNRFFSSSRFKKKELSTNLPLESFYRENNIKINKCGENNSSPVLVSLPLYQINTFIPDLEEIKYNNPSILLIPNPLSVMDLNLKCENASLNGFFRAASEFFDVFVFNSIFCERKSGGFIALDDETLAKELESLFPLSGEYPDYGTTLDYTARHILKVWNEEKIQKEIKIFKNKTDFNSNNSDNKPVNITGYTLTIENDKINHCINNKNNYNLFVNSLKLPFAYLLEDYFISAKNGIEIDLRSSQELRESLTGTGNSSEIIEENNNITDVKQWL